MDKVYENLKYIRSSLSGQLRGKYPYHNVPLRARWHSPGLAVIENMETGDTWFGDGSSHDIRKAILCLLHEQIPQGIRLREYLKAAAEALRVGKAKEVPSPFWQTIWQDLMGSTTHDPELFVLAGDKGPVLRVRMGDYVWGGLPINEALQHWSFGDIRWELLRLYCKGTQMLDAFADEDADWRTECKAIGAYYEPLQEN